MRPRVLAIFFALMLIAATSGGAQPLGSWQQLPPTPTPRTEVAVVNHDGKVYLIGGFTPNGATDRVEVFDPADNSWSERAPLPRALHHTTAVSLNGKIYVVGGFASGFWIPVDTTYQYDPQQDRWREQANLPTARGALAAVVMAGKIHAVGGARKKLFRLVNTPAHEAYDPATDTWEKLADLPTPRDHLTVSVADGVLYAIGGRINVNYNDNLNVTEAFDPVTGIWQSRAPLPTARSGITSQTVAGKIYVFGGESGEGTFDENEVFIASENRWETRAPMPRACHGLGSAVVGGKIHLLTGGPKPGGGGSTFHQVFSPAL